jgi:hypothetical protein
MLSTNHCLVRLQPPACTGARPSLPTTTNVVPIPVLLAHPRIVAQWQARQETQLTTCNVGVVLQPRFPGRYSRVAAHPCHPCTLSHAQQLWRPSTYSILFRRERVTFILDKTWRCPPSVCPFARQVSDGIMNIVPSQIHRKAQAQKHVLCTQICIKAGHQLDLSNDALVMF